MNEIVGICISCNKWLYTNPPQQLLVININRSETLAILCQKCTTEMIKNTLANEIIKTETSIGRN